MLTIPTTHLPLSFSYSGALFGTQRHTAVLREERQVLQVVLLDALVHVVDLRSSSSRVILVVGRARLR